MTAVFKRAKPYGANQLNLPVANVEAALPFYETVMGFHVVARHATPHRAALLERDGLQIGLAENGGDPTQEGCFFEVDNVVAAFAELQAGGLDRDVPGFRIDHYGANAYKVFFVVAPDGLCYCLGERHG
jgi:catechol 2,3-dioxygenase-like lactoylglutathione lyase family enzyme